MILEKKCLCLSSWIQISQTRFKYFLKTQKKMKIKSSTKVIRGSKYKYIFFPWSLVVLKLMELKETNPKARWIVWVRIFSVIHQMTTVRPFFNSGLWGLKSCCWVSATWITVPIILNRIIFSFAPNKYIFVSH